MFARIRRSTEFWNFLIDRLNSQYVLFEFKNYSKKINQGSGPHDREIHAQAGIASRGHHIDQSRGW